MLQTLTETKTTDRNRALTFAILGCGARGQTFARWIAEHPAQGQVVAIAEPREDRQNLIGDLCIVPKAQRFSCWTELLARPRMADVIINTMMDQLHTPSAIAALNLGYHMLLEKPMAVTMQDCVAIDQAQRANDRMVSVCHSLRYQATYREVKRLLDAGEIGTVVSIDQLEGVDPVHQSHSFVRGNWGNETRSTFMLLAKSCHDIDVLLHLVGRDCLRVSSFGSLTHFTPASKPAGAPSRCSDGCPHESACPYSALKSYAKGEGWGRYIGLDRLTQAQRDEFVRTSPYGLCVYNTDNDVVDHQVVNFEFEGGATGTFTMTAFAPGGRHLRVHGTHGYISADIDRRKIEVHRFWGPDAGSRNIELPEEQGGHGGGDSNVISSLIRAIRGDDATAVLTGTAESLRTHTIAFAAETARRERRVIDIADFTERHELSLGGRRRR